MHVPLWVLGWASGCLGNTTPWSLGPFSHLALRQRITVMQFVWIKQTLLGPFCGHHSMDIREGAPCSLWLSTQAAVMSKWGKNTPLKPQLSEFAFNCSLKHGNVSILHVNLSSVGNLCVHSSQHVSVGWHFNSHYVLTVTERCIDDMFIKAKLASACFPRQKQNLLSFSFGFWDICRNNKPLSLCPLSVCFNTINIRKKLHVVYKQT